MAWETVSNYESKKDELHAARVNKTKEQSIVISAFKTDLPLIFGGFGKRRNKLHP